jgi:hypothetical protein
MTLRIGVVAFFIYVLVVVIVSMHNAVVLYSINEPLQSYIEIVEALVGRKDSTIDDEEGWSLVEVLELMCCVGAA